MNKIAVALYIIGGLCIVGGLVVGFSMYEVPVEGYQYVTDKDYGVLVTWIASGAISGIIFFAFAEIINLLQNNSNHSKELTVLMGKLVSGEEKSNTKSDIANDSDIQSDSNNNENNQSMDDLREELKERGYGNDMIEAIIASKQ